MVTEETHPGYTRPARPVEHIHHGVDARGKVGPPARRAQCSDLGLQSRWVIVQVNDVRHLVAGGRGSVSIMLKDRNDVASGLLQRGLSDGATLKYVLKGLGVTGADEKKM